jgi:uncharacterized membrane protein YjgN (DUF898 family)
MTTLDAIVPATHPRAAPFSLAPGPVQFLGYERAYWRLLIRGAVLLAVTLGIYRFWLTTDMRRFLWSNTEVLGETLEYTGTARELLIGFLIACAILVPLYALLFALALNLGAIGQLASLIGFAALTVLGHYAVYRARRYRLTRTIYRGVRFLQTGSAWRYAITATFWWVIVMLSLGLLYPLLQSRLERFKMRNTYLGNLPGRFEGTAGSLFLRGILLWIIVIGPLIAALVGVIAAFDMKAIDDLARGGGAVAIRRVTTNNPAFSAALGLGVGAITWSFLAAFVLYPVFQAIVLRWWVNGVRFGDVVVSSHLRTGQVYGAYLRFIGWSFVFSTMASIAVAICFLLIKLIIDKPGMNSGGAEIVGAVIGLVGYVAVALGYSTIYQVKVRLGLWRMTAESVDLKNTAVLEQVSSVGAPSSPVGEGLADALNVGGF